MKHSILSEKQKGATLVTWLIVVAVVVILAGAAVFLVPKLKGPEPTAKKSVTTSKIAAVPQQKRVQKIPSAPEAADKPAAEAPSVQNIAAEADANATAPANVPAPAGAPVTGETATGQSDAGKGTEESVETAAKVPAATAQAAPETTKPAVQSAPAEKAAATSSDKAEKTVAAAPSPVPVATPSEVKPVPIAKPSVQPVTPAPAKTTAQAAPAAPAPAKVDPTPVKIESAPAPAPKKAAATEPSGKPLPFTIQFGAFRTKAYADDLLAKLKKRGYEPYIEEIVDANDMSMYLVRMGRYETRSEVADALARFKEKENMNAVIAITKSR